MEFQSAKLVYFSPTGTTKSVLQAIARGMGDASPKSVDITLPGARKNTLTASPNDFLIVGVPVYGGRVPPLVTGWLRSLKADRTPAVCVAVYGNREYEDALVELKDIVTECGGIPVACGAFIGEHSFSNPDTPIAVARPDAADLERAERFGREIAEKLRPLASTDDVAEFDVPGNRPYLPLKDRPAVDFINVSDACTQCGICAQLCPTAAIDFEDGTATDPTKCIWCCACIKGCPEEARTIKPGSPIMDFANKLTNMCKDRKEPVSFL